MAVFLQRAIGEQQFAGGFGENHLEGLFPPPDYSDQFRARWTARYFNRDGNSACDDAVLRRRIPLAFAAAPPLFRGCIPAGACCGDLVQRSERAVSRRALHRSVHYATRDVCNAGRLFMADATDGTVGKVAPALSFESTRGPHRRIPLVAGLAYFRQVERNFADIV